MGRVKQEPRRTLGRYKPFRLGTHGNNLYRPEFANTAYHLALLGALVPQIALAIGVGQRTVERWIAEKPDFAMAIRRGRDQADGEVAASLFGRAKGYSHPDVHVAVWKDRKTGELEVVTTPMTKYYPPDTLACIFWLKNRQRDLWRDVNRMEHTGADGRPIQKVLTMDLSNLTDEELNLAERLGLHLSGDKDEDDAVLNGNTTVN
jgi:hypothetical protein